MRVTYHSGRGFGAKHNDRNFESKAEHIDSEKTKDNITWHYYSQDAPEMTFEEAEKKFYAEHFALALDERNQKYRDTRNYKLIKTIDDYYKSRKTCPEDVILQVGRYDDNISKEQLADIYAEYRQWHYKKYPNVQLLSMALHADEPDAGAHIQERQAWIAHDKNGNLCISQSLALQEMGVERPDPTKPEGRHNNAKMTYTAACRAKIQEIARAHGLTIETVPMEPGRAGLSLAAYKLRRDTERAQSIRNSTKRIGDAIKRVVHATPQLLEAIAKGGKAKQQAAAWYNQRIKEINDAGTNIGIQLDGLRDTRTKESQQRV